MNLIQGLNTLSVALILIGFFAPTFALLWAMADDFNLKHPPLWVLVTAAFCLTVGAFLKGLTS